MSSSVPMVCAAASGSPGRVTAVATASRTSLFSQALTRGLKPATTLRARTMAAVGGWEAQTSVRMRGVPARTASAPLRRARADGEGSVGGGGDATGPSSVQAPVDTVVAAHEAVIDYGAAQLG